jgi:hypothetical protein
LWSYPRKERGEGNVQSLAKGWYYTGCNCASYHRITRLLHQPSHVSGMLRAPCLPPHLAHYPVPLHIPALAAEPSKPHDEMLQDGLKQSPLARHWYHCHCNKKACDSESFRATQSLISYSRLESWSHLFSYAMRCVEF